MVASTTSGYGAMEIFDNSDIHTSAGLGNVHEPYSSFTGGGKKKVKKSKKRTPLRKPVSKKTKRLARLRAKSVKSIERREKKLSKRIKKSKSNNSPSMDVGEGLFATFIPSTQKYVSKKTKKKRRQYAPKSKSIIKFSDFKLKPTKEKSKKRAMKRRKGDTR